jgi:hypothetical protein
MKEHEVETFELGMTKDQAKIDTVFTRIKNEFPEKYTEAMTGIMGPYFDDLYEAGADKEDYRKMMLALGETVVMIIEGTIPTNTTFVTSLKGQLGYESINTLFDELMTEEGGE